VSEEHGPTRTRNGEAAAPSPYTGRDPATASAPSNAADGLFTRARETPGGLALRLARRTLTGRLFFKDTTYGDLASLADFVARDLLARGARPGDRVCLFVPPGPELFAATFGLFRAGLVPVLIDPGMGRRNLLACVGRMAPRLFLGVPRAALLRRLFPAAFASVEIAITVGPWLDRAARLSPTLSATDRAHAPCPPTDPDDPAAILFTSGSTGPPKGVHYTHGNFLAQVERLQKLYAFTPGEVDLSCFPLFALFCPALSMTSIIPEVNPSRPAAFNPTRLLEVARSAGATTSFGSPAIWRRLVPFCEKRGERLTGIRRVLMAGAPVPPELIERLHRILPDDAEVHTPYGSTEALPVASISGRAILATATGASGQVLGTCVGHPAPDTEVCLIPIHDDPGAQWAELDQVPVGQVGEICVRGPQVSRAYAEDPAATAAAKLNDGETFWHRMGDAGLFDEDGRLWFQGRVSQRLETILGRILPVPVELPFLAHPCVSRCALVGVGPRGRERPVLVVEPQAGQFPRGRRERARLRSELFALVPATRAPEEVQGPGCVEEILFHRSFPVDLRHNAKIDRAALKLWAEARLS
jgi:acyl-CoA synthetase (AMP-forming)/AMP-acid ligase II